MRERSHGFLGLPAFSLFLKRAVKVFLSFFIVGGSLQKVAAQPNTSIQIFSKQNYYTTEKNSTIVCTLPDGIDHHNYTAVILDRKKDTVQSRPFTASALEQDIPLNFCPLGKNRFFVHVLKS